MNDLLKLSDKVYALEIDLNQLYENKRLRAKIGYTTKDMNKRIAGFRMSGNLKGKEYLVKKIFVSNSILAKSIERIATEIAILRGYERVNDKNLGLGYTEWFYFTWSILLDWIHLSKASLSIYFDIVVLFA